MYKACKNEQTALKLPTWKTSVVKSFQIYFREIVNGGGGGSTSVTSEPLKTLPTYVYVSAPNSKYWNQYF